MNTRVVSDPSWTFKYLPDALRELGVVPQRVLHIGAHWGEEVPTYVHCGFDRIVLVEPDPMSVQKIQQQPWFGESGAIIVEAAVAPEGERARFYRVPGSVWSGLQPAVGREPPTAEFDVDLVRIDTLQEQYRPNVLVVDTQGTELEALSSADLSTLDLVIVETQEEGVDGAHPGELRRFAEEHDWRIAVVWDRTGGWTDALLVPLTAIEVSERQ